MTHQIENPNSWYLKDRAARDRAMEKPDSGKLQRMERDYLAMMGERAPVSMDISPAPAMALEFKDVPLHSKNWKDLQARIKKYKMRSEFKIERVGKWNTAYLVNVRPDARDAFKRDLEAGYVQIVTGWAK